MQRAALLLCICAFLHSCLLMAQPADRARTEALAKRAAERMQALQREAERLASQETSLLTELRRLEIDRQLKAEQLKMATADLAKTQAELDATTARMASLTAEEAAERPEVQARLVEMYKLGQARYARLLLATPDLRRLGQASRLVAALAKMDRDRIAAHQKTIAELASTRTALEQRGREASAVRAASEKTQAAAARAAQAQTELIREIDRRRDLNAQLAGELQAAQQKLQAALRDAAPGAGTEPTALPLRPFRGDLNWPIDGSIRKPFGRPAAAAAASPAKGVEISAPDGTLVTAVHDGVVAFAGNFSGFGNLVILDHGSQSFSLYGDLLDVAVAKGARLDRGQAVGVAGPLPGGGTGLYFELRVDGQVVDPLQWLKKR